MIRKITFKLAAGILSLAVVAATADQASAGWRWHGSSGGSSGGYGSSGGWGGGSAGGYGSGGGWGGSSGGWGSAGGSSGGWAGGSSGGGGWHKRGLFHHNRTWGGWGSSGGSSGGWSGGSSGGWGGSSGGYGGGSYYYGPMEIQGKQLDPSTAPMNPEAPPVEGTRETSIRRANGMLAVNVPQDAKIFVNGTPTTSTGSDRQYVSRDLENGFNYTYEVKAEVVRDGKTIEQVKTINLRAGQTAELAFDFPAAATVETALTVHVPADAKVFLAGNPTSAKGEKRVFRTTGLSSGKAWDDYTIRVEFEQDGQTVSQERTITLKAGEAKELTFAGEAEKVAAR